MPKKIITNIFIFLARADVFCYALLWLIIIVILDTIAQKNLGIYDAQQKYFSLGFIWIIKWIPLPGGNITIAILFFSLLSKLVVTGIQINVIGTTIVHIGSLLLLLGGFITGYYSKEGSMVIYEGGSSNYFFDANRMELVVTKPSENNKPEDSEEIVFTENQLISNNILKNSSLPFTVSINKYCKKCNFVEHSEPISEDEAYGIAKFFTIESSKTTQNNDETNAGILFTISSNIGSKDYLVTEHMAKPQAVENGNKKYFISLRHLRTSLPFSIHLAKFTKQMYPGTNNPKKYASSIIIEDRDLRWESNIEMNKPLRYKGYTFYQASFIDSTDNQASILSVVKNEGRLFPYISSIIICIGLLIHIIQTVPKLLQTNKKIINKNMS